MLRLKETVPRKEEEQNKNKSKNEINKNKIKWNLSSGRVTKNHEQREGTRKDTTSETELQERRRGVADEGLSKDKKITRIKDGDIKKKSTKTKKLER